MTELIYSFSLRASAWLESNASQLPVGYAFGTGFAAPFGAAGLLIAATGALLVRARPMTPQLGIAGGGRP